MSAPNPYDAVPYPDLCYTQSHPNHLAALGTLLGMQQAPVTGCRVLELGCAVGGNLIPMAYGLPDSEFVGVDNAGRQIAEGKRRIEQLGLTNISLRHMDIRDITDELGTFDYIIAHGVYSWVPPEIQDRVLHTFKQNLAAEGIGYISYNLYPGWHMLAMVRQMMLYHTRDVDEPLERARKARELVQFLAEGAAKENSAYGSFLETYRTMLAKRRDHLHERQDSLLLHDELESVNDPVYFHEFARRAASHGLQYLTETDFPTVMPTRFKEETREKLAAMSGDIIEMEQYMDFLRNRTFRKTLVCHDDAAVERSLQPERVVTLFFSARIKPTSDKPDIRGDSTERFEALDGAGLSTNHPVSKAAFLHLARTAPQASDFNTLLEAGLQTVYGGESPDQAARARDAQVLATNLLRAFTYSMKLMEFHASPPAFTTRIKARPVASHYARLQAQKGHQVTSLRHERINLDTLTRFLLPLLDGAHDRNALRQKISEWEERDALELNEPGQVEDELDKALRWLALGALLV